MPALDQRWRVSTRSGGSGNCVEVRLINGDIEVRDTKHRTGPTLTFPPTAWSTLTATLKITNLA